MPDDHSEVVPLLPIPNRTVKRLCADDSAGSRVKVGHRQAIKASNAPIRDDRGVCFCANGFELAVQQAEASASGVQHIISGAPRRTRPHQVVHKRSDPGGILCFRKIAVVHIGKVVGCASPCEQFSLGHSLHFQ